MRVWVWRDRESIPEFTTLTISTIYMAVFYFPRFIWKKFEGQRMKKLCEGLRDTVNMNLKDKFRAYLFLKGNDACRTLKLGKP